MTIKVLQQFPVGLLPVPSQVTKAPSRLTSRCGCANSKVAAAAVDRFYAPSVIYYGKRFSRADVLADKLRYI